MTAAMSLGVDGNLAYRAKADFDRLAIRMNKAVEKVSSGKRINRAADDASGLAISELQRAQARGAAYTEMNMKNAMSLLQVAEAGAVNVQDMVQRVRMLAVQAANDTATDTDRQQIQKEVNQLLAEIDRQGQTVQYNTKELLGGDFAGTGGSSRTYDSAPVGSVTTAMAIPNYYELRSADPTVIPPGGGGAGLIEFTDNAYNNAAVATDGGTTGFVTATVGNNEALRFQWHPTTTDPNLVTSVGFRFVGGSSANGVTPDTLNMQLNKTLRVDAPYENSSSESIAHAIR